MVFSGWLRTGAQTAPRESSSYRRIQTSTTITFGEHIAMFAEVFCWIRVRYPVCNGFLLFLLCSYRRFDISQIHIASCSLLEAKNRRLCGVERTLPR